MNRGEFLKTLGVLGVWSLVWLGYLLKSKKSSQDACSALAGDLWDLEEHRAEIEKLFCNLKIEDFSEEWQEYQDKRSERYKWSGDEKRDKMYGWPSHRERARKGFRTMITNGDLKRVLDLCDESEEPKVPYDIVFLAIAESYRQGSAASNVAWWYRQFTKASAKAYGLIKDGKDNRWDVVESTKAAIHHLQDNYKRITKWCEKDNKKLSESDKRKFVFWNYNGSPKLVRRWFKASKGNPEDYMRIINNTESANYVPRILWIRDALRSDMTRNDSIKTVPTNISEADEAYQDYLEQKRTMNSDEKGGKLKEILNLYRKSHEDKEIDDVYFNWAREVIEGELKDNKQVEKWEVSILWVNDNEITYVDPDEIKQKPWTFYTIGWNTNPQVMRYIFNSNGNKSDVKRVFDKKKISMVTSYNVFDELEEDNIYIDRECEIPMGDIEVSNKKWLNPVVFIKVDRK